jgi:hypothetical protein
VAVLISLDTIVGAVFGLLGGAFVAWQVNKITNSELWAHVRRHCEEHDTAKNRLSDHALRLRRGEARLAVLEHICE